MGSSLKLTQSLTELRSALVDARLPLALPGAADQSAAARQITAQLDDYILPRLVNLEAPLLAVIGGSTGAGKSTLVNTLIGRVVSAPGVIRPTTKSPVLIFNPKDEGWFDDDRVLSGLIRTRVPSTDQSSLQLVPEPTLPPGLALLDAPDVDSVVEANRRLSSQLLEAADLWLFVTSAARYADAVPWEFLQAAARRNAAVAVVLDRVPPAAMRVIPADLGRLMTERGLDDSPLFAVPETVTDELGLLPDAAVSPIRAWLATLAADKASRQRIVMQTLDGAIGSLTTRAPGVAAAIQAQLETVDALQQDASKSFDEASRAVAVQTADGTLLRGEVLSRWHDYVGTGEFTRAMDEKISWLRDKLTGALRGEPSAGQEVAVAARSGLEILLVEEARAAAERAGRAWLGNPAGRQLLLAHPDLAKASPDVPDAVSRLIRGWQTDVMTLVAEEGRGKRKGARIAALGVNGVGAALMLVIFSQTAGLTGAEIGVAGGSAVLAQKLLESIFGEDAVRRLAVIAKQQLDERVHALMAGELGRYEQALADLQVTGERAARIREASERVNIARAEGYEEFDFHPQTGRAAALPPAEQQGAIDSGSPAAIGRGAVEETVRIRQVTGDNSGELVEAELIEQPRGDQR